MGKYDRICIMNKINYQKKTEEIIASFGGTRKTLLIHSCCAPCSSYVLEYLKEYFDITVLYYNPNIQPADEFHHRLSEQKRLCKEVYPNMEVLVPDYDNSEFFSAVKGFETLGENSERCFACYRLRMKCAAEYAKVHHFDYFTTTLSVSPYKNAQKLNEIGYALEKETGAKYFPADFKKKEGYKRSIELSRKYNLYRQDYCGCVFSKAEGH